MIQLHLELEPERAGRGSDAITPLNIYASQSPVRAPKFAGRLELTSEVATELLLTLLRGSDHIGSGTSVSVELNGQAADLSLKPLVTPWANDTDPWMYPTPDGRDNAQNAALRDQRKRPLAIQELLNSTRENPERIEQLCNRIQKA